MFYGIDIMLIYKTLPFVSCSIIDLINASAKSTSENNSKTNIVMITLRMQSCLSKHFIEK